MRGKRGATWFVRGFLLSLLLATAVFPRLARTQIAGNAGLDAEAARPPGGDTAEMATDDPQGRQQISLQDDEPQPPSNLAFQAVPADAAPVVSDDPQGGPRGPVPIDASESSSNLPSLEQDRLADVPAWSAAASRREEAVRSATAYTSPLIIPAADFAADGFDPDSQFFSFGGGYWGGNATAYGCLIAPAYLPHGATVTDMFASVYDNDGGRDFTVTLRRVNNFAGGTTAMASAATSSAFAGVTVISDSSIADPVVTYPDFSYYLTLCLGSSSLRLYSVRLYYSTP